MRAERGYRLGLPAGDVDASPAGRGPRGAGPPSGRRPRRRPRPGPRAPPWRPGVATTGLGDCGPTARRHQAVAAAVLGRSLSALGDHAEALPLLEAAARGRGDDGRAAALEAAVHGAPAALERYEHHRTDVADRLGVDPGPDCRRCTPSCWPPTVPSARACASAPTTSWAATRTCGPCARPSASPCVSILGPGGLGKTRLAHLLGLEAEQPVVHFVELVGVASPEDVVGEVGSALGVRDSVIGRRVLTADQRADVRARTAQHARPGPDPADPRQLRARRRRGRRAGRLPRRQLPSPARRHHHPRAAGHRRRARLPPRPAGRRRRRPSCSGTAPRPRGPA